MRVLISTSLLTLFAISAFAGVMPEDIHATSNQISETIEVVQGTEVINLYLSLLLKNIWMD